MSRAFVLTVPWGLFGADEDGGPPARRPLDDGGVITVPARYGVLLAAPEAAHVVVHGRRMAAQADGPVFRWDGEAFRLRTLPVGARTGEADLHVTITHGNDRIRAHIRLEDHLPRPAADDDRNDAAPDPAAELEALVLGTVGRINALLDDRDHAEPDSRGGARMRIEADHLADQWLDASVNREPPMDLIVRHAEDLRHLVVALGEHPRRVLTRVRERRPVARIQEMDAACLTWYVRQPGRTAAVKAGPRQQLLAVARRESADTVENRVLKDFLARSAGAARLYARVNAGYRSSLRHARVRRYGAVCRRLGRGLDDLGVADPGPGVRPNYVLLHEPRYRKVWAAYQALLRREDAEDEAWRWQRRLWADFCRLTVLAALIFAARDSIALEPVALRREQARGRWTEGPAQAGLFLLCDAERLAVAAPIDAQGDAAADPHPKRPDWLAALGPAAVVYVEAADGTAAGHVLVWTVHGTGAEDPPLGDLARAAAAALGRAAALREVYEGRRPRLRGLVLRSERTPKAAADENSSALSQLGIGSCSRPDPKSRLETAFAGDVTALAFGPGADRLHLAIQELGTLLDQAMAEVLQWR